MVARHRSELRNITLAALACAALGFALWLNSSTPAEAIYAVDTWEPQDALPAPRNLHATAQVDSYVLVIGGESADCTFEDTVFALHYYFGAPWQTRAPLPLGPRSRLGAMTVGDRVYAIGGSSGCGGAHQTYSRNEEYNRITNTWATRASMIEAREDFAIADGDGSIWVAGGHGAGGGCLQTAERYAPSLDRWFSIAPLPMPYCDDGGSHAIGSANGFTIIQGRLQPPLTYTAATNSWTTGAPIPRDRDGFDVVVGGYVIGGTDHTPSLAPATSILLYSAGSWSEVLAPVGLSPRRGLRVERSPDYDGQAPLNYYRDRIFAIGGSDASLGSTRFTTTEATILEPGNTPTPTPTGNNDGDGIPASLDNCPYQGNGAQDNSDFQPWPNGTMVPDDDLTWPTYFVGRGLGNFPLGEPYGSGYPGDACDREDDGDGLLDIDEASGVLCGGTTTTPTEIDSDGDHLTDWWECDNGSDPNDALSKVLGSGGADSDGDRVPDTWEQRGYHSSHTSADTDGNGCGDLVEIASVDGNATIGIVDQLAVARRSLNIWPPDPDQDYVLDISKNGMVGIEDRLFVARAAFLPDWVPKSCP